MKFLKIFFTFIVSLLLFLTIFSYTIILNVKNVVQNQVATEVVKTMIKKKSADLSNEEKQKINDAIDSFSSDKELDNVITSLIQEIKNVSEGKDVSNESVELVIKFCVNHVDDINKIANTNYTVSDIDNAESRENLKKSIKEVYKDISKDDSKALVDLVTTYGTVTSSKSTIYVIGIIVVLIVLLGLINMSPYKWIKPFGIVLAVSGSLVSIIYLGFNILYDFIINDIKLDISIDTRTILIYGVGEIIAGVVILVVYNVINKIVKNTKVEPNLINNNLSI